MQTGRCGYSECDVDDKGSISYARSLGGNRVDDGLEDANVGPRRRVSSYRRGNVHPIGFENKLYFDIMDNHFRLRQRHLIKQPGVRYMKHHYV